MASNLTKLQSVASQASKYLAENAPAYYKQLLEKNKQYIQDPPSVETCNLLSKQLLYTRLASIPGRAESFWKEFDHAKGLLKRRKELTTDDYGIAALFAVESYVLFKAGEIVGRGFAFPGYRL